jgi:hypothetical protein
MELIKKVSAGALLFLFPLACSATTLTVQADIGNGVVGYSAIDTWANVISASTGDYAAYTNNTVDAPEADNVFGHRYNFRQFLSFDLSTLPAGFVVDSASVFISRTGGGAPDGPFDIIFTGASQVSTTSLSNSDYSQVSSTEYSRVSSDDIVNGFNEFIFNSTGKSAISAGTFKTAVRSSFDVDGGAGPTTFYNYETFSTVHAGGGTVPYITLDYHIASSSSSSSSSPSGSGSYLDTSTGSILIGHSYCDDFIPGTVDGSGHYLTAPVCDVWSHSIEIQGVHFFISSWTDIAFWAVFLLIALGTCVIVIYVVMRSAWRTVRARKNSSFTTRNVYR